MILEIGTMHGFSDMPTLPVPARHCTEVYLSFHKVFIKRHRRRFIN